MNASKNTMNCVQKFIFPCIETLLCVDGNISHLTWHQARFNRTQKEYFGVLCSIPLAAYLHPPKEGRFRIRIVYDTQIQSVEYIPFTPKEILTLGLVESTIEYNYKYANRDALVSLIPPSVDDVLITCKDELKDTTIANIALLIEGVWVTPLHPLLRGTTRERLLASGFLKAASLTTASLQKAEKFAIMNALIGFKIINDLNIKGL